MNEEITGARNIVGYKQYPVIHNFEEGLPYSLSEFESKLPDSVHTHTDEDDEYIHFQFVVYTDGVVDFKFEEAQKRILEEGKKFHHMAELYIQESGVILFKFSNVQTHTWGRSAANNTALALEKAVDDTKLFSQSKSFLSEAEYGITHPILSASNILLLLTENEVTRESTVERNAGEIDSQSDIIYKYSFEESDGFVEFNLESETIDATFEAEEEPKQFLELLTKRLYTSDLGTFTYPFEDEFDKRWLYPFFLKHKNPGIDFWESVYEDFFDIKEVLRPSEKTEHLKETYGPIKSLKMFVDLYSSFTYSLNYIFREQYENLHSSLHEAGYNLQTQEKFVDLFSEFESSLQTLSKFDSLSDDFVNYRNEDIETGDEYIVPSELGPAEIKIRIGEEKPLLDLSKVKQEFSEIDIKEEDLKDAFWSPIARPIEVLEIVSFDGPEETAEEYKNFIKQNEDILTYSMLKSKKEIEE